MPPQRTSKGRPAGSKSKPFTGYSSSPERVYQPSSKYYTHRPTEAARYPAVTWYSSKPGASLASIAPYCSPTSPLPFSIYNFMPPSSKAPVQSPSFEKGASDRGKPPKEAIGSGNSMAFVFPQSLPRAEDGQPLPKPMRPPPQPQPKSKQLKPSQGQDLYHCPDCSLPGAVPAHAVSTSKQQPQKQNEFEQEIKQQPPPVYDVSPDGDWIQATGSPDSASDSESTCACSVACDCFDDAVTVAADDGTQEAGDVDADYCRCSDSASSSGDWVDVAPSHPQGERGQEQDPPSSRGGPSSLSRSSPQPPPPPPPSPSGRRRRHHGGSAEARSEDVEMRREPESSWSGGCC